MYPPQGNVRWFTWAEVAFQLERKLDASIAVVNQVDDFAVDTRSTLRAILDAKMNELILELALIADAATLVTLARLAHVHDYLPALQNELAAYHSAAVAQLAVNQTPTPAERWEFWRERALILPFWFKAALEVAIVFTSSGCVERVFSLYDSLFGGLRRAHWRTSVKPL